MNNPRTNVLDHGYLQYVEHMGSDERFIEAARMSVDKGFLGWGALKQCVRCKLTFAATQPVAGYPCMEKEHRVGEPDIHQWKEIKGDEYLLAHLWNNQHTTPFEMGGIVVEVMAPLMVYREWHRHRTQGFNEMSARYVALPDLNYVPDAADIVARSLAALETKNRQAGSTGVAISAEGAARWLAELNDVYAHAQRVYARGLEAGVPKELARLPVPVARYSRMRAVANPLNWMKFLTLRTPSTAQKEIRLYAEAFATSVFEPLFPRTYVLWKDGMALWQEFQAWRAARLAPTKTPIDARVV